MQQHERAFEELGARIVVVTFETPAAARAFVQDTGVRWTVLVDDTRSLYGAYGMQRGRLWDIWGPRTWWAYARELARGRMPGPAHADTSQLGGNVVIDRHGIVCFLHVASGPADRPSVAALLGACQPPP